MKEPFLLAMSLITFTFTLLWWRLPAVWAHPTSIFSIERAVMASRASQSYNCFFFFFVLSFSLNWSILFVFFFFKENKNLIVRFLFWIKGNMGFDCNGKLSLELWGVLLGQRFEKKEGNFKSWVLKTFFYFCVLCFHSKLLFLSTKSQC